VEFRIKGHGDFENFPAIPVLAGFVTVVRTPLRLKAGRALGE